MPTLGLKETQSKLQAHNLFYRLNPAPFENDRRAGSGGLGQFSDVPYHEFMYRIFHAVHTPGLQVSSRLYHHLAVAMESCGVGMFSHYLGRSQSQFPNYKNWKILKKALELDSTYDAFFEEREKNSLALKSSMGDTRGSRHFKYLKKEFRKHIPQSEESAKWEGWKYGKITLRPSMESIYFGQKPPLRPVSENVSTYGIGALNVGGCKVKGRDGKTRLPANVMHDGFPEVVDALGKGVSALSEFPHESFFYISKPNAKERGQIKHPTLKPLALMRQLVKLVTPKGRTCLDPFMGSGTTGLACSMEGVEFVGIEREREYFEEARGRLGDCAYCEE